MKASAQVALFVLLVVGVRGIRAALSTGTGAACSNISSERLEVLEAFIEAPAGSLDTADFIAAVYEAFAPEAVLYVPETGSYTGVESIAEYALVVDGKFTNGTFQATSYTINPEEIIVADDWIQATALVTGTFFQGTANEVNVTDEPTTFNTSFAACSAQIQYAEVTFDPELVFWLSAGIPSDIDTCQIIQQSCVGNNIQYGSVAECLSYMQKLPSQSCAESSFQGECKQCKWLHHVMATYKPDVHCIHVGPVGGPDIYGDYLCNTTACVEPYEQLGILY